MTGQDGETERFDAGAFDAGAFDAEAFDAEAALALLTAEESRVRRALDPHLPETLLAWGVAWLGGLGAIWWETRSQMPYAGPSWSGAVLGVLIALAAALTGWRVSRATRGRGGEASRRGSLYGLGWVTSFAAHFLIMGALAKGGASDSVLGILGCCLPLLIVGVMYLFGAAIFGVGVMAVLGLWLGVLAGFAGFAGPTGATGLGAVLGGGAFLIAGVWLGAHGRRHG